MQERFVKKVARYLLKRGNRFEVTSQDFLDLDCKNIVGEHVISTFNDVQTKNMGRQQFEECLKDCLMKRTTSIFEQKEMNQLHMFICPTQLNISREM